MCEKEYPNNTPETPNDSSWQDDIEKRDYYYDDSTGYEVYIEEDEENSLDSCGSNSSS
ncbi:MAG TPA: hypothetical protein PKY82_23255 [Pyrinomonadaceae bacterium]|nr:hypothetical protein [Pyrinomonadaceae bacterium]